jgi:alginate O-acetyltransferase complex protein AlgI
LYLGHSFFTFQIYGDFSGYSDIAIGTARLFGFNLMQNFAFPYFSRDIAEFWRRWHISLSTWFRDYLYIPLGGSRGSLAQKIKNVFIIFIVSGFWHGANWTFIIWGLLNAIYFLPIFLAKRNRTHLNVAAENRALPSGREFLMILVTFSLTVFAWIFFRAENLGHAFQYVSGLFSTSIFELPTVQDMRQGAITLLTIAFLIVIEWNSRAWQYGIEKTGMGWPRIGRWLFYMAMVWALFWLGGSSQEFIYFQF